MITEFELSEKFQPFYKSGKSICVTSDGFIIADDGENVNYLNRSTLQKIGNFNEENEEVTCFVANPNDYTVIIANRNLMLRRIDRFDKQIRPKTWNSRHTSPIFAMCLNKTSTRLTTGGADNKVRILHIGQGEGNSYSCIYHKSKINIVKNNPVEDFVVSSSMLDYEVVAWNTETGKRMGIFAGHQNLVTGIDFHVASMQMITSSRDETVIVWNWKTFEKLSLIPTQEQVETCIVLDNFMNTPPNDEYLIMVGGVNGVMKTISPHCKSIVQEFIKASLFDNENRTDAKNNKSALKTIRSIIHVDDSIVVVRESDNIEFYSKQMKLEYELAGDLGEIKDVIMIGENRDLLLAVESAPYMRLFSCSSFFENKNSGIEQAAQWPCQLISGGHTKDITSVSAFSDGLMVVSGGKDGKVCIWRVMTENRLKLKLVASLENDDNIVRYLCVDGDGKRIYVNYSKDDTLVVLSFKNDKLTRECAFTKPHNDIISTMDVNINSTLLATGSKDKCAKIWCFKSKTKDIELKGVLKGHTRGLWSVKFSKLEQVLLTSSMDKTIKLWSVANFSLISNIPLEYVVYRALFYNNEKQIIACNSEGLINVWDREKVKVVTEVKVHDESIDCVTLLTDRDDNVRGFAAAGGSAMISLYRDISDLHQIQNKEAHEAEIQQRQELDNLLFQKQYSRALRLAIKLNRPLAVYQILVQIYRMETQTIEPMDPVSLTNKTEIGRAVRELKKDDMQKLFKIVIKLNTNDKTFVIGTIIISVIMCAVPISELLLWPAFVDNIMVLHAYSTRYYRRFEEEVDHTAFHEYLKDVVTALQYVDLTMDTS